MNGYVKLRVCKDGRYADCWQKVEEGSVVDHVNDGGASVSLPDGSESFCLDSRVWFAPNVATAPDAVPPAPVLALAVPSDGEPPLLGEA